jgi:hypothetical protein
MMTSTKAHEVGSSYILEFKNITYDVSKKKFYYEGEDIYDAPYNTDIPKILNKMYNKLSKQIFVEENSVNIERKQEEKYLRKPKKVKKPVANIDKLIKTIESYCKKYPFVIMGERAIYESALTLGQEYTSIFDEITTLSIYQENHDISDFLSALKRINKFAALAYDYDHIKIYRLGKFKIEILLKNDNQEENTELNLGDIQDMVKEFRHSGYFYKKVLDEENEDDFLVDDELNYEFVNKSKHMIYRLILMLSRKKVLDKERKLVSILIDEAAKDESILNDCKKIIEEYKLNTLIEKSLNTINTSNSSKIKNYLL